MKSRKDRQVEHQHGDTIAQRKREFRERSLDQLRRGVVTENSFMSREDAKKARFKFKV